MTSKKTCTAAKTDDRNAARCKFLQEKQKFEKQHKSQHYNDEELMVPNRMLDMIGLEGMKVMTPMNMSGMNPNFLMSAFLIERILARPMQPNVELQCGMNMKDAVGVILNIQQDITKDSLRKIIEKLDRQNFGEICMAEVMRCSHCDSTTSVKQETWTIAQL